MTSNAYGQNRTRNRPCHGDNALNVAETAFNLLISGPSPLALDGTAIGHGLPARSIDLGELRQILLGDDAGDPVKDAVWAELVTRARTGDSAWLVGCVGVALPGLKNIAARVIATSPPGLAEDICSELLTEFIAQLNKIDITRGRIGTRLVFWARKAALRTRGRQVRQHRAEITGVPWLPEPFPTPDADPTVLLNEAVRRQIITAEAAELINITRLQAVPLADVARARRVPADRLTKRRARAEARLAAAFAEGQVLAITTDLLSDPGC